MPTSMGVPEFPDATSEEGEYYQKVLLAVERWFSLFGWPGGFFPITVPHSLRRYLPLPSARNDYNSDVLFKRCPFSYFFRIVPKIETSLTSALSLRVTQNKGAK